ncbi:MAG: helix-turn-helix transcriptional regulator [Clostridia bacterium]|nr:helix-turn-helix transcriptional regulator [Clostridia bacterium]
MENKPYASWEDVRKKLNITPEQQAEIKLEEDIIKATIEARKKNKLTQRELSKKSGVKQPVIARIEKCVNSPQTSTLIKLLYPMGYTLKVVPLDDIKNINE